MVPGDPALEELRRRVYAPGATDEDRAAYRRVIETVDAPKAAVSGTSQTQTQTLIQSEGSRAGGRRHLRLVLTSGVAVVAAVGTLVAVLPRADPGPPVPAPTSLSVDPDIRAAFLQNLDAGRIAGIADYLRSERFETPLRDATRYVVLAEERGVGPQSTRLGWDEDAPPAGRATVIVIVRTPAYAGWTLSTLRPFLRADDPSNLLGMRAGQAEAGTPSIAAVHYYSATLPATLRIDVPKGVEWGAAVVLSDR